MVVGRCLPHSGIVGKGRDGFRGYGRKLRPGSCPHWRNPLLQRPPACSACGPRSASSARRVELVLEPLAERWVLTTEKERDPRRGLPLVRAVVARLFQIASERLLDATARASSRAILAPLSSRQDLPPRHQMALCLQEDSRCLCIYNTIQGTGSSSRKSRGF